MKKTLITMSALVMALMATAESFTAGNETYTYTVTGS